MPDIQVRQEQPVAFTTCSGTDAWNMMQELAHGDPEITQISTVRLYRGQNRGVGDTRAGQQWRVDIDVQMRRAIHICGSTWFRFRPIFWR